MYSYVPRSIANYATCTFRRLHWNSQVDDLLNKKYKLVHDGIFLLSHHDSLLLAGWAKASAKNRNDGGYF